MELMEFMDSLYYDDRYLEHHGVKGQKWGVRRAQKSSGGGKRGGSSKGVSNERVKGGVLSSLASNRKVRIAAGIAAAAIVGVAAYTLAAPQIAGAVTAGTNAIRSYTRSSGLKSVMAVRQNFKVPSSLKSIAAQYGLGATLRAHNSYLEKTLPHTVRDSNTVKFFDKDHPGHFDSPTDYKGRHDIYFDKDSSSGPYGYNDRRRKK